MSTLSRIIRLNTLKSVIYNVLRTSTQTDIKPASKLWITPFIQHQQNSINLRLPNVNQHSVTLPSGMLWNPHIHEKVDKIIEEPVDNSIDNTIQAAKLIVIRRKKMKKHKLRKLRKRMKFEWAKLRQRRELRKEKLFQAELIQKCKTAEEFSAEDYVDKRIAEYNRIIIPKRWKGRRMPEFMIRERMGLPPKN
ncbi:Mitochondrial mRNA-processing protein COX24, C-terminal [Popillia japonica]|uniref:Small ribosomal subunit protein mS38 n=1 Tax=Popillia japonica TaxID=7064 RepID=A0AAW1KQJ0_POPJA